MKNIRKPLSCLLALLFIVLPLTAFAEGGAAKEETVYAKLSRDGTLKELYVVNSFELNEARAIKDYGAYSAVRNLSTTELLSYENGEVRANAPAGRFYYEGKLYPASQDKASVESPKAESAMLPWDFHIEYLLNGKAQNPDQLAGKRGTLEIAIDVKQNPHAQKAFFENNALQISLSLDSQKSGKIVADGAVIANAGKNKLINFMLLPGTEKRFSVKANVVDFAMEGISFNGTVMSIDFELENREELTKGFKELSDGIGKLNDGTLTLKDGSKEYESGIRKFSKETGTLSGASSQMESGLNKASKGMRSLVQQTAELKDLALSLQNNLDPRVQGLAKGFLAQYEAMAKLSGGIKTLAEQYGKMDTGIHKMGSAAKKLSSAYEELNDGIVKLSQGTAELKQNTSTMDKDINTKIDEMIADFTRSDYVPVSFTSPKNTAVQSVQFVIRSEAIELPEKEQAAEEESEEPKTFFQRLIALFKA